MKVKRFMLLFVMIVIGSAIISTAQNVTLYNSSTPFNNFSAWSNSGCTRDDNIFCTGPGQETTFNSLPNLSTNGGEFYVEFESNLTVLFVNSAFFAEWCENNEIPTCSRILALVGNIGSSGLDAINPGTANRFNVTGVTGLGLAHSLIKIVFRNNNSWDIYTNNTYKGNLPKSSVATNGTLFMFRSSTGSSFSIANFVVVNISAAAPPPPIPVESFLHIIDVEFPNSNATSTSFQTIATIDFTLNKSTTIGSFVSAEVERLGPGTDITELRLLIDDIEISRSIITMTPNSFDVVSLNGVTSSPLGIGSHNVTLQHRRDGTVTVQTSNIHVVANTRLVGPNLTSLAGAAANASSITTNGTMQVLLNTTFTQLQGGTVYVISHVNPSSSTANDEVEIITEFNGQNSSSVFSTLDQASSFSDLMWVSQFQNVSEGNHSLKLYGEIVGSTLATWNNVVINAFSTNTSDTSLKNDYNLTSLANLPTSSGFIEVGRVTLNLSPGNDMIGLATVAATRNSAGGAEELEIFSGITTTNSTSGEIIYDNSSILRSTFPNNGDRTTLAVIQFHRSVTEHVGVHNWSIYMRGQSGDYIIDNLSMVAAEARLGNFTLIIPDNPPTANMISPANNTITNETTVNFNVTFADDNQLVNATLFHNRSGTFQSNGTVSLSGMSQTVIFSRTIPFNATIIWNAEVFDNASQSAFSVDNFTLTINQTSFPPPPPVPNNITIGVFQIGVCPSQNTTTVLLLFGFIALAFGLMIMALVMRNGLIGFMGGALFMILSFFLYACIVIMGILTTAAGMWFMFLFLKLGISNFKQVRF